MATPVSNSNRIRKARDVPSPAPLPGPGGRSVACDKLGAAPPDGVPLGHGQGHGHWLGTNAGSPPLTGRKFGGIDFGIRTDLSRTPCLYLFFSVSHLA